MPRPDSNHKESSWLVLHPPKNRSVDNVRKHGSGWQARTCVDGVKVSKTFPTKNEAKLWINPKRGELIADSVDGYEWAQFCVATNTNPTLVRREIERGVKAIRTQLPHVSGMVLRDGAVSEVVNRIIEVVEAECSRQLSLAPLIKEVLDSAR